MRVELIVPLCFIESLVHAECIVIDTLIFPLSVFIKQVHLFGVGVGIDHIEVQAGVLLEEGTPGSSAPVIILRDGDHLVHWDERRFNAAELKSIEFEQACVRVELHAKNKTLARHLALNEEGQE